MTQTLIEKLEALQRYAIDDVGCKDAVDYGDYLLVDDLRAIIEEYKATEQDTDLSPEDILIANEEADEQEQRIEKLRKLLVNDKDATSILNLLLEHGLSKSEIREKLGMHDKSFWAADRRLQRAVMKIGET